MLLRQDSPRRWWNSDPSNIFLVQAIDYCYPRFSFPTATDACDTVLQYEASVASMKCPSVHLCCPSVASMKSSHFWAPLVHSSSSVIEIVIGLTAERRLPSWVVRRKEKLGHRRALETLFPAYINFNLLRHVSMGWMNQTQTWLH
jgi:hypothetical protein